MRAFIKIFISVGIALLVLAGASIYLLIFANNDVEVFITDEAPWFSPPVLEIKPGTTVTWHLNSPAVHPVMTIEQPDDKEINSGHFTDTWSYTFTKSGVYVYICPIHPYMKGVIGVGQKVPEDKIPSWVKDWPPEDKSPPGELPATPGIGEIWVGAQFHKPTGKISPGTIVIINAETWKVEDVLADNRLNNPHNLWQVNDKVLVTNWFDLFVSVFDKETRVLEKHVWVGESPAHVHSSTNGEIYVTLQGDSSLAVLNEHFEVVRKLRAPKGPHGHWMSSDGKLMALASTEKGKISVWNVENDSILFESFVGTEEEDMNEDSAEDHPHSLPLFAGITHDGAYAFTATSAEEKFYVFDVNQRKLLKSFEIGMMPIQTVPSPDGRYVIVPLGGDGAVAVVSTTSWDIVKKIPDVGAGAHGVFYGKKSDGGWYAYVSNKFARWVTVIDMDTLEIAGYIPLPEGAFGGQGILVV